MVFKSSTRGTILFFEYQNIWGNYEPHVSAEKGVIMLEKFMIIGKIEHPYYSFKWLQSILLYFSLSIMLEIMGICWLHCTSLENAYNLRFGAINRKLIWEIWINSRSLHSKIISLIRPIPYSHHILFSDCIIPFKNPFRCFKFIYSCINWRWTDGSMATFLIIDPQGQRGGGGGSRGKNALFWFFNML